jgi:lipoprotein NlpD
MRAVAALLCLALAACGSAPRVADTPIHVVRSGETLYSIAWRYGIDYQTLARWNGLSDPNLIYVGQSIRLTAPPAVPSAAPAAGRSAPAAGRAAVGNAPAAQVSVSEDRSAPEWRWPTRGPIVSAFGERESIASGISIGGRQGQSIDAAAAGRVVYAGSGLIGYGQLVIIKHNDTWLSAYGYNSRLLVSQGDEVERGAEIAKMGLGPDQRPQLHFEIRQNGVPVNPMPYLDGNRLDRN